MQPRRTAFARVTLVSLVERRSSSSASKSFLDCIMVPQTLFSLLVASCFLTGIVSLKCVHRPPLSVTRQLNPNILRHVQHSPLMPRQSHMHLQGYNGYGEEPKGINFKVAGIFAFVAIGVFGTGSISTFKNLLTENVSPPTKTASDKKELKNGSKDGVQRGAMTRLTRKEINTKLQQVPVFYASVDNGDTIYTGDNSEGMLFVEKPDADAYASSHPGCKVSASTLDSVYYTLIEKKAKLGKFIEGVAGKSNPEATYRLQMSPVERKNVPASWQEAHAAGDIPLYRVPNLYFSKQEGLEVPFFTRREDAYLSYDRLQESKGFEKGNYPDLQVTSLNDLVTIFSTGGTQSRAFEIYPSAEAVEYARALILQ